MFFTHLIKPLLQIKPRILFNYYLTGITPTNPQPGQEVLCIKMCFCFKKQNLIWGSYSFSGNKMLQNWGTNVTL